MTALRDVLASLWAAVRSPRVVLLLWVTLTAIAIWPAARAADAAANDHVRWSSPTVLPADGDHLASLRVDLTASLLLALVLGVLFAGGILACVGTGDRRPFREFLAEGAHSFLANGRVVAVFAFLALLLGWGLDAADQWLRVTLLAQKEPGDVALGLPVFDLRWLHVLAMWDFLRGGLFVALVFTSKVAMAWLLANRRRSAVVAASAAMWCCLRQPLRFVILVGAWLVLWLGISFASGELTVRLLEVRGDVWLGALASQLGVAGSIVVWIGFTASARSLVGARAV